MTLDSLLYDPDLGGTELIILRKTWTEQSGTPELADLQRIFTYGVIHPADPDGLDRTPEESVHLRVYHRFFPEAFSHGWGGITTSTVLLYIP